MRKPWTYQATSGEISVCPHSWALTRHESVLLSLFPIAFSFCLRKWLKVSKLHTLYDRHRVITCSEGLYQLGASQIYNYYSDHPWSKFFATFFVVKNLSFFSCQRRRGDCVFMPFFKPGTRRERVSPPRTRTQIRLWSVSGKFEDFMCIVALHVEKMRTQFQEPVDPTQFGQFVISKLWTLLWTVIIWAGSTYVNVLSPVMMADAFTPSQMLWKQSKVVLGVKALIKQFQWKWKPSAWKQSRVGGLDLDPSDGWQLSVFSAAPSLPSSAAGGALRPHPTKCEANLKSKLLKTLRTVGAFCVLSPSERVRLILEWTQPIWAQSGHQTCVITAQGEFIQLLSNRAFAWLIGASGGITNVAGHYS